MRKAYLLTTFMVIFITAVLISGCAEPVKKSQAGEGPNEAVEVTVKKSEHKITKKAPHIEVEDDVYNFGSISPGSKNVCEFNFKNTGEDILHIKRVTKTCGCTPFSLKKKKYAPGESGTLKVSFHASKRPGETQKRLTMFTNDPENEKVRLTIKAEIIEKVSYEPERMTLSLRKENAGCPDITLKSLDDKPFSIKSFDATGGAITTDFDPQAEKKQFVLSPEVDVEKLSRVSNGTINIGITHPELDEINIFFDTIKEFKLNPSRIVYLKAEPGKTINRKVWILNNYEEEFEVESVNSEKGIMEVAEQKKAGENRYEISVDITAPGKEGATRVFRDTLLIKLKSGKTLEVPCTGFFASD